MSTLLGRLRTLFVGRRAEAHYERFMAVSTRVFSDEDVVLAFDEISAAIIIDERNPWYRLQRANHFLAHELALKRKGVHYTIGDARRDSELGLRAAATGSDQELLNHIREQLRLIEELAQTSKGDRQG